MDEDYIIRDSSIYDDYQASSLYDSKDCCVRIGTIRDSLYLSDFDEVRYVVEVFNNGHFIPITCQRTSSFGGVYNYEEYTLTGFVPGKTDSADVINALPGDKVIVAYANGDAREGLILGFLNHTARKRSINDPADSVFNTRIEFVNQDGPSKTAYVSEFNGLMKSINKKGEYMVMYQGTPTNIDSIYESAEGQEVEPPQYSNSVAGSYYKFSANGSWELNDNNEQSVFMDKENGQIVITSGATQLVIDKAKESYSITNKITSFESTDEFTVKTTKTDFDASNLFQVKAKDIKTSGKWTQKGDIKITGATSQTGNVEINGDFKTSGQTLLAGGANALIYEIVLIQGTGNKGKPVISQATVLKTVQTKAT